MSVEVVGIKAAQLAVQQGFRAQHGFSSFRAVGTTTTTRLDGLCWDGVDTEYRVHPDDQAAFIAKNTPKQTKAQAFIVWQGVLLENNQEVQVCNGSEDTPALGGKEYVLSRLLYVSKHNYTQDYLARKLRITAKGTHVIETITVRKGQVVDG